MKKLGDIIAEQNIILTDADILTTGGYTRVPNHALKSPKISPGAKLAYAMLLNYAWQNDFCFPGQEKLADDMGVSLRSIKTYIQELDREGFINIKRRGQGKTNLYELILTANKK